MILTYLYMDRTKGKFLSDTQIEEFLKDGILVVDNVLSPEEVSRSLRVSMKHYVDIG